MNTLVQEDFLTIPLSKRLIVALDFPDDKEALACAERLKPFGVTFKVGMQLFYQAGMPLVHQLQAEGNAVFLDLKLHDIPNTVEKATESLVSQGGTFFNVHAQGGPDMMAASAQAAKKMAAEKGLPRPTVIAVTLLTSLNQQHLKDHLKTSASITEYAVHLAKSAKQSGLQGVVCSAQEAQAIREACGQDFILITPGIRPQGSDSQDQSRILTPQKAIEAGSTYLVVGRPITQASNPVDATSRILDEMQAAIEGNA
jgi:orotidine-5'-phosphate decarboxylase